MVYFCIFWYIKTWIIPFCISELQVNEEFRIDDIKSPWVIPFCISELQGLNKKLQDYTPSDPELAKLDVRDVVLRLSIEMQIQNNVLMTALRHLHEKDKTS